LYYVLDVFDHAMDGSSTPLQDNKRWSGTPPA
jgi:hypothetical protein